MKPPASIDRDRLLQRLVPAENRGCEPCPPLVNSPIPADGESKAPEPVESLQPVEALVADLEAEYSRLKALRTELIRKGDIENWKTALLESVRVQLLISRRRRSATGGNGALRSGGKEP